MSNIQSARAELKSWLQRLTRIDKFDADPPTQLYSQHSTLNNPLPANSCIAFPVKDLQYMQTSYNGLQGEGRFSYQIIYRYSHELTLDTLPVGKLEGLIQYLHGQCLLSLGGCEGIRRVDPAAEEYPIQISRDGADQNDWLIFVNLALDVQFAVTEFGLDDDFAPIGPTPDPLVPFDEINLKIYRAVNGFKTYDPADSTLDANIILENNNG